MNNIYSKLSIRIFEFRKAIRAEVFLHDDRTNRKHCENDLVIATVKQKSYLKNQLDTISNTWTKIQNKKASGRSSESLDIRGTWDEN